MTPSADIHELVASARRQWGAFAAWMAAQHAVRAMLAGDVARSLCWTQVARATDTPPPVA